MKVSTIETVKEMVWSSVYPKGLMILMESSTQHSTAKMLSMVPRKDFQKPHWKAEKKERAYSMAQMKPDLLGWRCSSELDFLVPKELRKVLLSVLSALPTINDDHPIIRQ